MTVEQQIEANLSPRCQDTIAYMEAHQGGYVKPTHKPLASHDEERKSISSKDAAELQWFDDWTKQLRENGCTLCTNL